MNQKIKLKIAGLPADGRRAAPADADHAVQVLDLTRRGYRVSAMSDETPWWHVSISRSEGPLFSNQPDGTTDVLFVNTLYANEDARLYDDKPWPEWITTLIRHIERIAPDNIYVRTGVNLGEEAHG